MSSTDAPRAWRRNTVCSMSSVITGGRPRVGYGDPAILDGNIDRAVADAGYFQWGDSTAMVNRSAVIRCLGILEDRLS